MSVVLPGSNIVFTGKTKYRPDIHPLFRFLTTILIVIFASSGIFGILQPPVQAAEGPHGLSRLDLPAKGNPKLDSALNSRISDNSGGNSRTLVAQEGLPPGGNNVRVIVESLPGRASEVSAAAGAMGRIEGSYQDYRRD